MNALNRYFGIQEAGSSIRTEILAGFTTFLTLGYIIFVQPAVLSIAGMDRGAVMAATCISSAVATLLMAFLAKYPIALAPAMGHNFYFSFVVCVSMGISWPVALGAVFISGVLFILLSTVGFRVRLIQAIPSSLNNAIAAGIGLLIALVGLQWGGLVVAAPGTYIDLGDLSSKPVLVCLFGVMVISILLARKWSSAILVGTFLTALVGLWAGVTHFQGFVAAPPSMTPTFLQLDIVGAFKQGIFTVIFVFFFLDLFDTIGTVVGVAELAGFLKDGEFPRAQQVLLSDAIGTCVGAICGTSTISSYIESSAGVAAGGRTGFTSVVVAILLLLALFFSPLVGMLGEPYPIAENTFVYPIVAPALILVGFFMIRCVTRINWSDPTEGIPCFLAMVMMPFGGLRIIEGIAFGFISYCLLKLVSGRGKEVSPILYIASVALLLRYIYLMK
jgi:AGZA family xanthine/uracil permease-like MFS transporter